MGLRSGNPAAKTRREKEALVVQKKGISAGDNLERDAGKKMSEIPFYYVHSKLHYNKDYSVYLTSTVALHA